MSAVTKLMTPGGGGVSLTPASSIASDVTVNVPSQNCTLGIQGPAFSAGIVSTQTVSVNTNTKIAFNTEQFDTNSNYDTSTYRFTPTVAGYYIIEVGAFAQSTNNANAVVATIFKNGSGTNHTSVSAASAYSYPYVLTCGILYMNGTTDYVEGYGMATGASGTLAIGGTVFSGVLVRAA